MATATSTKRTVQVPQSTKDLARGEQFLIERRRAGKNQVQFAKKYGVKLAVYRGWENDLDAEGLKAAPKVTLGKLAPHERFFLARRRNGMSLQELAKRMKLCRWWVRQMECGDAPCEKLAAYWK